MTVWRRVGVVGFGHLGAYLVDWIQQSDGFELAFVWNRTPDALSNKVKQELILTDLSNFAERKPDLIVEVAHPIISEEYGERFLEVSDYMVGSLTALAKQEVENKLRRAAKHHGLYIPSGAFWGGEDIQKMADRQTLRALKITMTKHTSSLKLNGDLREKNDKVKDKRVVLYDGPVRGLCALAPNNVNTMAAGAMCAHNLGFDKVQGCLVSDPNLPDWHIVEVDAWGPGNIAEGTAFHVLTTRKNPAKVGNVTGSATYISFASSIQRAGGLGPGVHLC